MAGVACVFSAYVTAGFTQNNWIWRNPVPTGNTLQAIAENSGTMMTVGNGGIVLASYDSGATWVNKNLGVNINLHEIVSSGGFFYALGDFTYFITFGNNGNFLAAKLVFQGVSNESLPPIFSMATHGGRFIVVGDNGFIASSSDSGTTWVKDSSPTPYALFHVLWTGNGFMGFGENGTIVVSTDGISWTLSNASGTSDISLRNAVKFDSMFVAVGSDIFNNAAIVTSFDGAVWNRVDLHTLNISASVFTRIIWTGTQFMVTGNLGTLLTSPDGVTWTVVNPRTSSDLNGIVKTASHVAVVGSGGAISTSNNGITWNIRSSSITINDINDVVWTGSQLIAVGENGQVLASNNGISWTVRDTGSSASLQKVIWTGSRLVAVGGVGRITVSSDGLTWEEQSSGDSVDDLYGLAWNGSRYVAAGDGGTIITSPDGTLWTPQNSGVSNLLSGVAWSGTEFIAVGDNATVLASTDGINWSPRTIATPTGLSFNGITSNGRTIVIIGEESIIFTSGDGKTWVQAYWDFLGGSLQDICWTGTCFVAVGSAGTVFASKPDSETVFSASAGNPIFSGCSQDFNGIAAMPANRLVAVGSLGTIMTSGVPLGVINPQHNKVLSSLSCHAADRRVFFSLSISSRVSARLINLNGKVMMTIADKAYDAGRYVIDLGPYKLSQGMYWFQLLTTHGETQTPVVIIR